MNLETILASNNIAENLDDEQLKEIGNRVVDGYDADKESRADWEERNAEGIRLALQVKKNKSFPWPNASNVKYPLITIACMQFNARAYPALVPGTKPVKHRVVGADPSGEKEARAKRVSTHMNYQLTVEDESWEDEMDRLLMSEALLGTCFKKSYFDPEVGTNVTEMVSADNLVLDYFARSVESTRRKTHVSFPYKNELISSMRMDIYKDCELSTDEYTPSEIQDATDESQGKVQPIEKDENVPFTVLEQHCWLDLDNDGYEEPYVVTVLQNLRKVLRIKPRFFAENIQRNKQGQVGKIVPVEMFTKYGLIPSPDGSIYDVGLGQLLTPINESVNSIINQLVDAGTLSNMQAGFIAKGIRVRNGQTQFTPGEWKTTNAMGDDLRKGIFPLPVREPSQVLFQLLGLLIEGGQKIGSASDLMTGQNPGQNQPAQTTMEVLEQGMKVYSAIIKRNHRSMTSEFRKIYALNALYANPQEYYGVIDEGTGKPEEIFRDDYKGDPKDIAPASDPNIVSDSQRLAKANALREAAAQKPHLYNQYEVEQRYMEALQIDGVDKVMIPIDQVQMPSDPEAELANAEFQHKSELENARFELDAQETVVNMKKTISDTQRSLVTADVDGRKQTLAEVQAIDNSELRRAELIAKTMSERNKNADEKRVSGVDSE